MSSEACLFSDVSHDLFEQDTPIKINSVSPGSCATDLSGNMGQPPALGAQVAVRLSTIGADGPTGGFFEADEVNPW